MTHDAKPATSTTKSCNEGVLSDLDFEDRTDFEDVNRGFLAPLADDGQVRNDAGAVVWNLGNYDFGEQGTPAPDTVNPSLWRQAKLLAKAGLFEVVEGIYQVRGIDLSVISFVEGPDGVVVVDPCTSKETATAALALYREQRGDRDVVAVIHTHTHTDHYGGVRGVVDQADVDAGRVKIFAPEGFMKGVIDEFVLAGTAMSRRVTYQYGALLEGGPQGTVTAGLGLGVPSGESTLVPPTDYIDHTGQTVTIAGLEFEFLMAPDTEAPAEMLFYIPRYRALCPAEEVAHTQHNVYTLRGARIRDPLAWSKYIKEARERWGDKSDVLFQPHHWPTWGTDKILEHLKIHSAMYRYLHDETLRLANSGYTMLEAAETVQLPDSIAKIWSTRPYYGTTSHNVKAIWVRYLGWYDGNPAHLWQLPPEEAAKRYVEFMGGADAVLDKARASFERGEYRWVAEVVNHVVFADPSNEDAKALQANTLEQLGYQAEAGTWRGWFLSGAKELRHGIDDLPVFNSVSADTVAAMPIESFLDYLAVRLNGPDAAKAHIVLNLQLTDTSERYALRVEHGVLDYDTGTAADADASLALDRAALNKLIGGAATLQDLIDSGAATLDGDGDALARFIGLLDTFEFWFDIVTP